MLPAILLVAAGMASAAPFLYGEDNWAYKAGPFELGVYTGQTEVPLTGRFYARINAEWDQMDFMLELDNAHAYPEYFPVFAVHVHHGNLVDPYFGHVLVSIAGKGDITGCWGVTDPTTVPPPQGTGKFSPDIAICSDKCLEPPFSYACKKCANTIDANHYPNLNTFKDFKDMLESGGVPPGTEGVCNLTLGFAHACNGGCDGDERPTWTTGTPPGNKAMASSRVCDEKDTRVESDMHQQIWYPGKYSFEMSGNSEDGDEYSHYSIYKKGNFDRFCGVRMQFIKDMLRPTSHPTSIGATYIALHLDFNATGTVSTNFGDLQAPLNAGEGVKVYNYNTGEEVAIPEDDGEEEFPYYIGNKDGIPFEDFATTGTSVPADFGAKIYVETTKNFDVFRWKYHIPQASKDKYPEYWPMFAMHLHAGDPAAGVYGHVIGSLFGVGDIIGNFTIVEKEDGSGLTYGICSDKCLDGDRSLYCVKDCDPALMIDASLPENADMVMQFYKGSSVNRGRQGPSAPGTPSPPSTPELPKGAWFTNLPLAFAEACSGGCMDTRTSGGAFPGTTVEYTTVASRNCDKDDPELISDRPMDTWYHGKYSHENAGSPMNSDYSPWSMYKTSTEQLNFARYCGIKLHFLRELLRADSTSYVALHMDFNATGVASTNTGDLHAIINDGSGAIVRRKSDDSLVTVPPYGACDEKTSDACGSTTAVKDCVCGFDPWCCEKYFDTQCKDESQSHCGADAACANSL